MADLENPPVYFHAADGRCHRAQVMSAQRHRLAHTTKLWRFLFHLSGMSLTWVRLCCCVCLCEQNTEKEFGNGEVTGNPLSILRLNFLRITHYGFSCHTITTQRNSIENWVSPEGCFVFSNPLNMCSVFWSGSNLWFSLVFKEIQYTQFSFYNSLISDILQVFDVFIFFPADCCPVMPGQWAT